MSTQDARNMKNFYDIASLMIAKIEGELIDEMDLAELERMRKRLSIARSAASGIVIRVCADTLKDFGPQINRLDENFLLTNDFSGYMAKKQLSADESRLVLKLLAMIRKGYTAMSRTDRQSVRNLFLELYQSSLEYCANAQ